MVSPTEVYKIPGAFNTPPSAWPRMAFPEVERGLIEDWIADDLPEGLLPEAGWVSRVGARALTPGLGTVAPTVVTDSRGVKAVRFVNSQLTNMALNDDWKGEMTFEIVLNPTAGQSGGARIISGPVGKFRGIYMYTSTFSATSSQSSNPNVSTSQLGSFTVGQTTALTARYKPNQVDGLVYGKGATSTPIDVTAATNQTQFYVGANSAAPPSPNTFLNADMYRLRVWNRALEDSELEAAMAESAAIFGF